MIKNSTPKYTPLFQSLPIFCAENYTIFTQFSYIPPQNSRTKKIDEPSGLQEINRKLLPAHGMNWQQVNTLAFSIFK